MRRITGALLLAIFVATQSGGLHYVHLRGHLGASPATRTRVTVAVPWPVDPHDPSTCAVCSVLHMPVAAAGYVPLLICFGLILAFLSLLTPQPAARRAFAWIESRGPPIR